MEPISVLWADADLVAALKPATLPVQADLTGDRDLLSFLQGQLGCGALHLLHRLDRPVSGVVLFARNAHAAAVLSEQFRTRAVEKVYWAIVEGQVNGAMHLAGDLVRDGKRRKAHIVQRAQGTAVLDIVPMARGDRYTLLQVRPQGGAFHQIRAQLAAAGHPIKGDVKYGARRGEKDRSILLHARSISFAHPRSGTRQEVVAPLPEGPLWKALAGS